MNNQGPARVISVAVRWSLLCQTNPFVCLRTTRVQSLGKQPARVGNNSLITPSPHEPFQPDSIRPPAASVPRRACPQDPRASLVCPINAQGILLIDKVNGKRQRKDERMKDDGRRIKKPPGELLRIVLNSSLQKAGVAPTRDACCDAFCSSPGRSGERPGLVTLSQTDHQSLLPLVSSSILRR
jgi:hypothetical protein